MTDKSDKVQQARWSLIRHALDEVYNPPDYSDFYTNTFSVIAKFGLQLKANEEKLFESGDWYNPDSRDDLFKKVRNFLIRHIK